MTNLKVGDRIRLSTGVEGFVHQLNDDGSFVFDTGNKKYFVDQDLEALSITWELIEPELVEPSIGSAIRFTVVGLPSDSRSIAWNESGDWLSTQGLYEWSSLVEEYGITDYELLRPEKEVVKEVLNRLLPLVTDPTENLWVVAKDYGVEL